MCSPARCGTCGKITWSGCGDHVDSVRAMVPDELWCPGHDDEANAGPTDSRSAFARLFNR
jgi:hypothetical protein